MRTERPRLSRRSKTGEPVVVRLAGELDLARQPEIERLLDDALSAGSPLVVDLGDCTYMGAAGLESIDDAGRRASEAGVGFVVVLPYDADSLVRRMILEIAPDLVWIAIAPTIAAAVRRLRPDARATGAVQAEREHLLALRAAVWEEGARLGELRLQRDRLVLEMRQMRELARRRRAG